MSSYSMGRALAWALAVHYTEFIGVVGLGFNLLE